MCEAVGVDGGRTAVFTGGTAVGAGFAGGIDGRECTGVGDAVGADSAAWTTCAGGAGGVGVAGAEGICAGVVAGGTGGVDSAGGAASVVLIAGLLIEAGDRKRLFI
jgi:hypothetical protein